MGNLHILLIIFLWDKKFYKKGRKGGSERGKEEEIKKKESERKEKWSYFTKCFSMFVEKTTSLYQVYETS